MPPHASAGQLSDYFDEIQTLPINLVHLFNLAAKFLVNACNSSIMLCTATQPLLHEVDPQPDPCPLMNTEKSK